MFDDLNLALRQNGLHRTAQALDRSAKTLGPTANAYHRTTEDTRLTATACARRPCGRRYAAPTLRSLWLWEEEAAPPQDGLTQA